MPAEAVASAVDPRDASVDEARSQHRHRQAGKTFRADLVGKGVSIGVRLLSIPLSIQLLGAERYGLWLTVSSVLMWLNLTQLGFGGGLLNEIGKASARDDRGLMRRYVSTGYAVFGVFAIAVFGIIVALSQTSLAPTLLGVAKAPNLQAEAQTVFLVAGALFAASLITNTVGSVCLGLQEGYLVYATFASSSVLSLFTLLAVYWLHGSMSAFAIAMSGPPLLANAALAAYVFSRRHPGLAPRFRYIHRDAMRPLLATGGGQTLVMLGDLTILNSTNPLIANRLGLEAVPHYAVPFAIFMLVAQVGHGLANSYMAAFSESSARHDWDWIRSTFAGACKKGAGLMALATAGVTLVGPAFIQFWTHGKVAPDRTLLAAMGVYFILKVLSLQSNVLFMAVGLTTQKAALQVFVAAVHIVGFFALVSRFGLLALPIAGGAAYLVDSLVARYIIWPRFIAKVERPA